MPTRQQNPGVIVRLVNLVKISMNFAVLCVFNQQWPEYYVSIRIRLYELDLVCNFFRQQIVVSVEILQPFALCQFRQPVPRSVASMIGPGLPTNLTVESPDLI